MCSKVAGAFIDKISERAQRSGGRVRADVVHEKLTSMCYTGSERTTRRVVTELKKSYRRENHPVYMVSELAGGADIVRGAHGSGSMLLKG